MGESGEQLSADRWLQPRGVPEDAAQVRSDLFPPKVFFFSFLNLSVCNSHLRGPHMPSSLRDPGIFTSLKPARAATGRENANWLEVLGKLKLF